MNDPEIRRLLLPALTGSIIEELPVSTTRADVAQLTAHGMHGYEIKGDGDTLKRVPMQLQCYGYVFNSVTFVVTEKHLAKLLPMLPEWVGVTVAYPSHLHQHRPPGINPGRHRTHVAVLLVQDEVKALLRRYEVPRVSKMRGWELWDYLLTADHIPLDAVADFVRQRLIERLPQRMEQRANSKVIRQQEQQRRRDHTAALDRMAAVWG